MKPATKLIPWGKSLYAWSSMHDQWKVDFHSYALKTRQGVVFIDPMKPAPSVAAKLDALGHPVGVFLTNAHHDRDADWFRKRYEIQIYAHEKARPDCDTKIDVLVMDGENLPGGVKVIHLPGVSSSETAFYSKLDGGIVLIGDSLLHESSDGLTLLPGQYCEDRAQAWSSLQKLLALKFEIVTFAHGEPLVIDAQKQINLFLKKRSRSTA